MMRLRNKANFTHARPRMAVTLAFQKAALIFYLQITG
jgi:hypothetical protein